VRCGCLVTHSGYEFRASTTVGLHLNFGGNVTELSTRNAYQYLRETLTGFSAFDPNARHRVMTPVFPYCNSRFPLCIWREHSLILSVLLAACPQFCWRSPKERRRSFRRLPCGVSWRECHMEVFATFGLIVLVGLGIPILLLLSALVFDLVVVIYAVTTRIGSRKRKPSTFGTVARSVGQRDSRGTAVVWSTSGGIAQR